MGATAVATTATEPAAWTGVVLAGGRSTRMGRDKAHLQWNGLPLLAHAESLLARAGAARVIISGDHPEFGGIHDTSPDLGPLGGLATVVDLVADGVLVLVPVDMPLLSSALLHELATRDAAPCVCFRNHVLPMRLQVDPRCRQELGRLLACAGAHRSLRTLHAELGGAFIEPPGSRIGELANCNTPEQWQAVAG